jgi:hypothetical protein
MSAAALVVAVVYVFWGAATIANQFRSWCPAWLTAIDVCGLIPTWTFFAPTPGMTDYYLLYRDRLADGSFDNWRQVELKGSENGWRLALWNPTKRRQKALSDTVNALIALSRGRASDALIVTVPYVLVLNLITSRPHSLGTTATQFMVLEHSGFSHEPDRSRVLVMSAVHRLR